MSPGARKGNGLSSPASTPSARDGIERDNARTTVLNVWSLASLEEILPRDLEPPYWSKNLVQSLAPLANQKTLAEAKILLAEQVVRRRRETTESRTRIHPREFLTIADVNAVLGGLDSRKQTAEPDPPAELSIVVAGTLSPEPSEVLSSNENADENRSTYSEDEPLAHSRRASRGPLAKDPDTRSSTETSSSPNNIHNNNNNNGAGTTATSNRNRRPIHKSGLAHPLSVSSLGSVPNSEKAAGATFVPSRNSPLADPTSTSRSVRPSTVNSIAYAATTETPQTRLRPTARQRVAPESRETGPSITNNPIQPRPLPKRPHKPTAQKTTAQPRQPPNPGLKPSPGKLTTASSNLCRTPVPSQTSLTSSPCTVPIPITTTSNPSSATPKPSTATTSASTPAAKSAPNLPNPSANTTGVSPNTPKALATDPRRVPNTVQLSPTGRGPHGDNATSKPASSNTGIVAAGVISSSQSRRGTPTLQTAGSSRFSDQTNIEKSQRNGQSRPNPQSQIGRVRSVSSSSTSPSTTTPLHPLSQAAFRLSTELAATPIQNTEPFQPPHLRPQPAPAPTLAPASTQLLSTKRKFSHISQERQVKEAELQLEINSAVHKRAKYRADEACKVYDVILREIEATSSRYGRLRKEAESIKSRAGNLEKELRQVAGSYPDILDLAGCGTHAISSENSAPSKTAVVMANGNINGYSGHSIGGGVNIPDNLAACFDLLIQSIRAKPSNLMEERDTAARSLLDLDSDLQLAQTEMKLASVEEGVRRTELKQQTTFFESLMAKEGGQ